MNEQVMDETVDNCFMDATDNENAKRCEAI